MNRRLAFWSLLGTLTLPGMLPGDMAPEPARNAAPSLTPQDASTQVAIEMAAEEVSLKLSPSRLQVEAVFHMRNPTSSEIRMKVGFPAGRDRDDLQEFAVTRDGKAADLGIVDRGPAGREAHDYGITWDAVYPAGKTVTEVVRYRMEVSPNSIPTLAGYILHTGAPWAGKIGKAVVTLTLAEGLSVDHLSGLQPAGSSRTDRGAVWTFRDLEPTEQDDIQVSFHFDTDALADASDRLAKTPGDPEASKAYCRAAGHMLDSYGIPEALEAGKILAIVRTYENDWWLRDQKRLPVLLHWAVDKAAKGDADARALLPRLKDLLTAMCDGRVRVDQRALRQEEEAYIRENTGKPGWVPREPVWPSEIEAKPAADQLPGVRTDLAAAERLLPPKGDTVYSPEQVLTLQGRLVNQRILCQGVLGGDVDGKDDPFERRRHPTLKRAELVSPRDLHETKAKDIPRLELVPPKEGMKALTPFTRSEVLVKGRLVGGRGPGDGALRLEVEEVRFPDRKPDPSLHPRTVAALKADPKLQGKPVALIGYVQDHGSAWPSPFLGDGPDKVQEMGKFPVGDGMGISPGPNLLLDTVERDLSLRNPAKGGWMRVEGFWSGPGQFEYFVAVLATPLTTEEAKAALRTENGR